MIVFLVLLAIITPWVIVDPLQDAVVLPKLVTTATFTGAALVWGGVLLARDRWPAGRWPATLWAPVSVFVAVNVLALVFALEWRWSLMGQYLRYQGLATTLLYVLLFAVAAVSVRTTRDLRWLLLGLSAGALGAAIYALIQKAGLDWVEWSGRSLGRPAGTLGQANAFGAYLVAVISAAGFLVLGAKARWQQAAIGVCVLAMAFALLFTFSRAGLVAAFLVLMIWSVAGTLWFAFYRVGQRPRPLEVAFVSFIAVVVTLAVAGFAILFLKYDFLKLDVAPGPLGRIQAAGDFQSEPIAGRISLWRLAVRMTADRPLLGGGQDAFTHLFAGYRDNPNMAGIGSQNVEPESAHNFFLDLASGTGILGLLAFLAFVGAVLWHAARRALESDDASLRLALVALGAAVVGYLVAIFFGFSEAMTSWSFWLLLGATFGLLAETPAATRREARRRVPSSRLASGAAAVALSLVGVAALGWAATLTAADLAAGQAQAAVSRGDYDAAIQLSGRAVSLNPLQKKYIIQKAETYRDASFGTPIGGATSLQQAVEVYHTAAARFEPTAFDAMSLALVEFELAQLEGQPVDGALNHIEQAILLDPYNAILRDFAADYFDEVGYPDRALRQRLEILSWK